jgi:integrase/recombinase XerD
MQHPRYEGLSEQEVMRLFKAVDNLKHRTMLLLLYSAGLRLGELLNMRKDDVLFDRKRIFVKAGKGKKRPLHALGR